MWKKEDSKPQAVTETPSSVAPASASYRDTPAFSPASSQPPVSAKKDKEHAEAVGHTSDDSPAAEFTDWLDEHGYREPDGFGDEVAGVCPDLIYRLPDSNAAVFFDDADRGGHAAVRLSRHRQQRTGFGVFAVD